MQTVRSELLIEKKYFVKQKCYFSKNTPSKQLKNVAAESSIEKTESSMESFLIKFS